MKNKKDDLAAMDALIQWSAQPDSSELESKAKRLVDQLFDDPSLAFQISALATTRERMKGIPSLFRYQQKIEAELFSEKNLADASVAELTNLWKSIREHVADDISLLKDASGTSERPRIEKKMQPVNRQAALQLIGK